MWGGGRPPSPYGLSANGVQKKISKKFEHPDDRLENGQSPSCMVMRVRWCGRSLKKMEQLILK